MIIQFINPLKDFQYEIKVNYAKFGSLVAWLKIRLGKIMLRLRCCLELKLLSKRKRISRWKAEIHLYSLELLSVSECIFTSATDDAIQSLSTYHMHSTSRSWPMICIHYAVVSSRLLSLATNGNVLIVVYILSAVSMTQNHLCLILLTCPLLLYRKLEHF